MNGRYPAISGSRPVSRQSNVSSRHVSPRESQEQLGGRSRTTSRQPSLEAFSAVFGQQRPAQAYPVLHPQPSYQRMPVELPAIDASQVIDPYAHGPAYVPPSVYTGKAPFRPKSAYELRAHYRNSKTGRSTPIEVVRKTAEANLMEDNTIRNISNGPYAAASPRMPSVNQENTRPPLPAVSSSEWLATGGTVKKRKEIKKASSMYMQPRPSRDTFGIAELSAAKRSPGQRLVTNWLDDRRSKENTPAFV
ncbi:hypothetical protein CLAFUW4_06392 [Fulvia fulva]|uniref:Uncharacterized protein n=1 Tax=Passalora fulva TaxID=5499 RepID=A0A9Q8P8U8_PASFU|nr:uncharacterized protein CLAFUR5_06536 [Fulvia fulva]KAK4624423.1 hypothetical protein CLAFUR4_06395 [Fulvia fulva]KAK4624881.1 hypothetical protein CLAFUR0_06396 [Fulvia fulva]UJO17610.1 hypothetical protein CLAFUR5_06536 [Fulvia fulva]WPV15305.1 hypothetical protein CLAFUW4_06392 [Fulvia fulva]WPV29756.1 hypothetical protein CLAFUW7_06390 [Fulvia fulva]